MRKCYPGMLWGLPWEPQHLMQEYFLRLDPRRAGEARLLKDPFALTVCPRFLLVIVWWYCVSCHRTHWPLSLLVCRELDGLLGSWLWHPQLGGLGKVYLVSGLQRWPILQCPAWCRAALAKVWRCCPAGGSLSLRFVSQLPFPNPQPGSQLRGRSPLSKGCCHQMALCASLGGFCKDHDCFLWHWLREMGIQHTCLNFWFFISLIAMITHEHIFVSYTDNLNIEVFFLSHVGTLNPHKNNMYFCLSVLL